MKILNKQIYLIVIGLIMIVFSYYYIDRQLVFLFADHNLRQYHILRYFTLLDYPINIFLLLIFLILPIRYYFKKWHRHDKAALALALSYVITIFLKNILKFIFGRYWPDSWFNNNLSLLHDGAYGFNWFESSIAYQSFPSGHVALITAAMTSLIISYPKLKYFALLIIILMVIGQVTMNYHFLSDAIAGALLGYLVAKNINNIIIK